MQDSTEIIRLRRLLGKERFDSERRKGQLLRKNEYEDADTTREGDINVGFGNLELATDIAMDASDIVKQDKEDASSSAGSSKIHFKPLWTGSEESLLQTESYSLDEEAIIGAEFCPILAVSRFPYKYLWNRKERMEAVASQSFNDGKFWRHRWSIFYIACSSVNSGKPLLLVPREEVDRILSEVEKNLNIIIKMPSQSQEPGFCVSFNAREPRPRFLGTSQSRGEFNLIADRAIASSLVNISNPECDKEAFEEKIDLAVKASKPRNHNSKTRKSRSGFKKNRSSVRERGYQQIIDAQRYLGLRPSTLPSKTETSASQETELADPRKGDPWSRLDYMQKINVEEPVAHTFLKDVVMIAIDVEAHERFPSMVTEVGVASLDTRNLQGHAPGRAASKWRDKIKYRHFRVEEFKDHVNKDFVVGCPDRFEPTFGSSEIIRKDDLCKALALACKPPYPRRVLPFLMNNSIQKNGTSQEQRNIVMVGHAFDSDVRYLRSVGFNPQDLSNLIQVIDTSMLYQALTGTNELPGLSTVLNSLDISAWNLHNAGNDAGYTLQAVLAIAVEQLTDPRYGFLETEKTGAARIGP